MCERVRVHASTHIFMLLNFGVHQLDNGRGVDNFRGGGLNVLTCKWPHLLYDTSCDQDAS